MKKLLVADDKAAGRELIRATALRPSAALVSSTRI
jgi:hypothetical protein